MTNVKSLVLVLFKDDNLGYVYGALPGCDKLGSGHDVEYL